MPLLINNEQYSAQTIESYSGDNEALLILQDKLKEIKRRFFDKGKNVVYRFNPRMIRKTKEGVIEHKKGIFIQWRDDLRTTKGLFQVTYYESVTLKPDGTKKYTPRGEWFHGRKILTDVDIELALYYFAVCTAINKGNKILLEDRDKENETLAEKRAKNSMLEFYIYAEDSPLSGNRGKLEALAYAWGVSGADKMTDATIKNSLYNRLKSNDAKKELSPDNFVENIKLETPFILSMMYIQKALDENVLEVSNGTWYIVDGQIKNRVFKIPPGEGSRAKIALAHYMMTNNDAFSDIKELTNYNPRESKTILESPKNEPVQSQDITHSPAEVVIDGEVYDFERMMILRDNDFERYKEYCNRYEVRYTAIKKEDSARSLLAAVALAQSE